MPLNFRSNNRVLPSNSRAVDVAKQTIRDVIPVQQRKYANAFEVQGFETIVYQKLLHGRPCSCQDHRGASASYLDQDGKLDAGTMDNLLSGGLVFKVDRYGARQPDRPDARANESRFADGQIFDGDEDVTNPAFDIVSDDLADPFAVTVTSENVEGVNGGSNPSTLDDAAEIFDGEAFLNDTRCAVCMGSGYVGGFSVLNGQRLVLSTTSDGLKSLDGFKEYNQVPHAFACKSVEFGVTLPKGTIGLDAFRVWNNTRTVSPTRITIDGLEYSDSLLLALCNGRTHVIKLEFDGTEDQEFTYFTHVEIQLNMSTVRALFELPRTSESSNMTLQDATDDLGLYASPQIPMLKREDVLVESTYGKTLVVSSCTSWSDRDRNILGWDLQTRVVQPAEMLNLLPRRRLAHQRTTYLVRDNVNGSRRT